MADAGIMDFDITDLAGHSGSQVSENRAQHQKDHMENSNNGVLPTNNDESKNTNSSVENVDASTFAAVLQFLQKHKLKVHGNIFLMNKKIVEVKLIFYWISAYS